MSSLSKVVFFFNLIIKGSDTLCIFCVWLTDLIKCESVVATVKCLQRATRQTEHRLNTAVPKPRKNSEKTFGGGGGGGNRPTPAARLVNFGSELDFNES